VGAGDVAATGAFLALFDLDQVASRTLDPGTAAALYGVEHPLDELLLAAPGAADGTVRVVGPAAAGAPDEPYARGAHALDFYTADLEASLARCREAGWRTGPVGHVVLGPLVMDQATVHGPGGLLVVLIASERRRPSLLDTDSSARHSQCHSLVWAVDSVADALPFWQALPGLTVPFDAPVAHPEVARFMELPDPEDALRMAMVCDVDVSPMRFELLEFVGRPGPQRASWPLAAGLHAPWFEVPDLDAALAAARTAGGEPGPVADVGACSVLAPGGVRLEVWERS
jgi:hypothetical protein